MASCRYFKQKAARTVVMRISPVLLLLPVLVLSGSTAIANDDRLASPQPAIASPVPAPLTIESLAGTYKIAIDEQRSPEAPEVWKEDGKDDSPVERYTRQIFESMKIIINADGTFEQEDIEGKSYGKVRLNGNELIFTTELIKPDNSTEVTKCPKNCISLYLYVTADGKTLLFYNPQNYGSQKPIPFFIRYVKQ